MIPAMSLLSMAEPFSRIPPLDALADVGRLRESTQVHRSSERIPGHGASIGDHQRTVGRSERSLIGELVPVQYDVRTWTGFSECPPAPAQRASL